MKIPVWEGAAISPELPGPRLSIAAGEMAGKSLAAFGESGIMMAKQLAVVEQHLEQSRLALATTELYGNLREKAQTFIDRPDTSVTPEEFQQTVRKSLLDDVTAYAQKIPDERLRNKLQAQLAGHVTDFSFKARIAAGTALHDQNLAEHNLQLQESIVRASQEPNETARAEIINTAIASGENMVATGHYHAAVWQAKKQKFLGEADEQTALVRGKVLPRQTIAALEDPQQYTNLSQERRWAVARELHARANQDDVDAQRERKRETDAVLGQIGQEIVHLPTGQPINEDLLYGRVADRGYEAFIHTQAMIERKKRQVEVVTNKASMDTSFRVQNELFDAFNAGRDLAPIVRRAQLAAADGQMNEGGMDHVWNLYTRLDGMNERADARAERESDRAERDKVKLQRHRVNQAMADFDSWFPSIKEPAMAMMAGDYYKTRAAAKTLALDAAEEGRSPVEALRQARPVLIKDLYGNAETAIKARKGILESRGIKTWEELRILKDRLPAMEYDRLVEQAQEMQELTRYLRANPPPRTESGGPGARTVPSD